MSSCVFQPFSRSPAVGVAVGGLVALLAACHSHGDSGEPWADAPYACSDAILVPIDGGARDGDDGPADPHADTPVGAHPEPLQINLGFPQDPSTSMGVTWATDADTLASQVEIRSGDFQPALMDGASYAFDVESGEWDTVRLHEVRVCGLQPSTAYTWRVGGEEAGWSPEYGFTTPPPAGSEDGPVRVAIAGDSNFGYVEWGRIASAIASHEPDLYIHTGDVLHSGNSQAEWESFFAEGEALLGHVPMVVAHGNHDELAHLYFGHMMLPGNEEYYSFDWATSHFVFLNDSERDDAVIQEEEVDFLAADLAATDQPWRFAAHHRPAYCSHDGGNSTVRDAWTPTYDAYDVNVVFNGHWHLYERSVPITGDQEVDSPADGTTYVVAGGAGAGLYGCGEDSWFTAICEKTYSYVIMDIAGDTLTMNAYRDDGSLLDTLVIDDR